MPVVGEKFLRYKIDSLIGSGGMGEVFLARDTQLNRNVAVKILKPKLSHRHGDALDRFMLAWVEENGPVPDDSITPESPADDIRRAVGLIEEAY